MKNKTTIQRLEEYIVLKEQIKSLINNKMDDIEDNREHFASRVLVANLESLKWFIECLLNEEKLDRYDLIDYGIQWGRYNAWREVRDILFEFDNPFEDDQSL